MQKRKTLTLTVLVGSLAAIVTSFAINTNGNLSNRLIKGTEEEYTLTLNADNALDFSNGDVGPNGESIGNAKTSLNNDIGFSCKNYNVDKMNKTDNYWIYLNDKTNTGYFYNKTPIHGIKSVTINTDNFNAPIIEWSGDSSFVDGKSSMFSLGGVRPIDGKTVYSMSYNFGNDFPNYIKIVNSTSNNSNGLVDVVITYSCINSYVEVVGTTSNEALGTVTGSRACLIGDDVTLVAAPNEGCIFKGWYNGTTKVSDELSYTLTNVILDTTLVAVFQQEVPETVGSTFSFGSYPQTKVTDTSLIEDLNEEGGTLPTAKEYQKWTSFGYIRSGTTYPYAWYQDIMHTNGHKYRGVYFDYYRSTSNSYTTNLSATSQDDFGYSTDTVYWFEYSPISWTIISVDEENNYALLLSDIILDAQHFSLSVGADDRNIYGSAPIMGFTNITFLNCAFNDYEKAAIKYDVISNAKETYGGDINYTDSNGKAFLLSLQDARNADYGFMTAAADKDVNRQKDATDYAKIQGLKHTNLNSYTWWLRSPKINSGDKARCVEPDGSISSAVNNCVNGIVPAIKIIL